MISKKWDRLIEQLDFAFQPIVNINSGVTYGFEVLLRNTKKIGFLSIHDFFDLAYIEGVLYRVDLQLRRKALKKFVELNKRNKNFKLFYNLDNRLVEMPDYAMGNTKKIIEELEINSDSICFEISERHRFDSFIDMKSLLNIYKNQGFSIAMDDFGAGYSGLQLLYYAEPEIIKIDRFFIIDIYKDFKKKLFISNIINIAHILGAKVIAEGIETRKEYLACKDIGCDLAQGYFIQKPNKDITQMKDIYSEIKAIKRNNQKEKKGGNALIYKEIEKMKAIPSHINISEAFEIFKNNKEAYLFPVINKQNEPIGIIKENSIKRYIYSPYGKEVLIKKMKGKDIKVLVERCAIVDINTPLNKLMEKTSLYDNSEGIIITDDNRYVGFLKNISLLRLLTEKNIKEARDQNPLTKLNGNFLIKKYIENVLDGTIKKNKEYILFYYDFNNFKPFNDYYGFQKGDEAIILFSNILKKYFMMENYFIGHIGGDDFFLGVELNEKIEFDGTVSLTNFISKKFQTEVLKLYNKKDLEQGYIISEDREGKKKKFNFLSIALVGVHIKNSKQDLNVEKISNIIFELKKQIKNIGTEFSISSIL